MLNKLFNDGESLALSAADQEAIAMRDALADRGRARIVGIGENGHVAFDDPPENFETEDPYIIVELNQPCRTQQVREGWLTGIAEVPKRTISMTRRRIMTAREIVSVVPNKRKARAAKMCLEGEISPMAPGSTLRRHPRATLYLDRDSASLLNSSLKSTLDRHSQATITS